MAICRTCEPPRANEEKRSETREQEVGCEHEARTKEGGANYEGNAGLGSYVSWVAGMTEQGLA